MVSESKTLEKEIHKIFESNIWLLNKEYEVWSSNNQLKTVLNECFDEQYRDKENLRPDIVCKTYSNKAIVLEFKRPSEKISLQNLIQVMRYRTIIKKSMPNLEVTTYLIGKGMFTRNS